MTGPSAPEERPTRRARRRRQRRERGRRAAALLPQLLTTGNLAAGFYSITLSFQGNIDRAALAIVFAALFDTLDGRVARLTRSTSRFGMQYDSIADTVSFGVAPAILAYSAGALQELGWTGWVLAFLYTACAALRLARFNVTPGRYAGRFDGLASPAAAGMVLSAVWFAGFLRESGLQFDMPAPLAGIGVAVVGLLMVSPIPYRSFKDVQLGGSFSSLVLVVVALVVLFSKPAVTFFLVGVAYVSSGPIEAIWRWRTGRSLTENPPHEPALPGPEEGGIHHG
ncbi:MAG: CDP-diacylglycerol--serine O-phosphatidyltransferase [Myxococcota bacterium]